MLLTQLKFISFLFWLSSRFHEFFIFFSQRKIIRAFLLRKKHLWIDVSQTYQPSSMIFSFILDSFISIMTIEAKTWKPIFHKKRCFDCKRSVVDGKGVCFKYLASRLFVTARVYSAYLNVSSFFESNVCFVSLLYLIQSYHYKNSVFVNYL